MPPQDKKEERKIKEDARGEAIKAIVDKIGYGISWETANEMITNLLKSWNNKN